MFQEKKEMKGAVFAERTRLGGPSPPGGIAEACGRKGRRIVRYGFWIVATP